MFDFKTPEAAATIAAAEATDALDRSWIDRMTGGSGTDPNRPKRVVPNGAPADRPREVQQPRPTQ